MALKIIRQANKIALIGAPVSAGAHGLGPERAPQALRDAGIVAKLTEAGFEVTDMGDIPAHAFVADDDSPRARNLRGVVNASLALKPLVEVAVKSGALPLILGGDCTIALGVIAGVRRYYPQVCLMYCDGDADLNTPATTPSGFVEGMVVAHIAGQGAPELVRITSDTPLVREPDIALFGTARLDPGEEAFLQRSPMRHYSSDEIRRKGAEVIARQAVERIHSGKKQMILHFDVDVISSTEMPAAIFGDENGLSFAQTEAALRIFCEREALAAILVTEYIAEKDADRAAARKLIDLLVGALRARLTQRVEQPQETVLPAASAGAATEEEPKPSESERTESSDAAITS